MRAPADSLLLRIIIGEEDNHDGRPLYRAIIARAGEHHLAGATALFCREGFGRSQAIRSELPIDAGEHLPVVVEIVDVQEKIDQFLPVLDQMMSSGLVTIEKVQVLQYGSEMTLPRATV